VVVSMVPPSDPDGSTDGRRFRTSPNCLLSQETATDALVRSIRRPLVTPKIGPNATGMITKYTGNAVPQTMILTLVAG
jgi:hypothetical protein